MTFELTILGANSANFAYGRHQTAQIISQSDNLYLVDCGEATQLQLLRYKIRLTRLNHIFISHLHGDHYLGLVGLIQTMQLQGRTTPLDIYGPLGLAEIITVQMRYSDTHLNFQLTIHPVKEGPSRLIFDSPHLEVHTIPLTHRVTCNGYLFVEKEGKRRIKAEMIKQYELQPAQVGALKRGHDLHHPDGSLYLSHQVATLPPRPPRRYAFCSDTIYKPDILPIIQNVDLLYHEATFTHNLLQRARQTFHTTALQAAELAREAGVTQLMLGHYSSRYRDLSPLLDEAREVFPSTILAEEGQVYTIPYPEAAPVGHEMEMQR